MKFRCYELLEVIGGQERCAQLGTASARPSGLLRVPSQSTQDSGLTEDASTIFEDGACDRYVPDLKHARVWRVMKGLPPAGFRSAFGDLAAFFGAEARGPRG